MLNSCNVCKSPDLEIVWELPDFPLTGIYVDNSEKIDFQNEHDQQLQFCPNCTHAQLGNQIDPSFLYRETYTHRTSESPISSAGNRYLLDFIKKITGTRKFNQILEIGCNDLFLLENLKDRSINQAGIDPIWTDGITYSDSGVRLWGGFAETTDYDSLLESKVDLLISAHTFEHVVDPLKVLESLQGRTSEDCLLIIEVPSAERMIEQGRLDQVFNQHVNYYSVNSLRKLFEPLGFSLVELDYNFAYWGGTQLLVFSRATATQDFQNFPLISTQEYLESIRIFSNSMESASRKIEESRGGVYLYGAAQMLPTLLYHFSAKAKKKIISIIDDNPSRQNKQFPNLDLEIVSSSQVGDLSKSVVVLGALDSSRPILKSLLEISPRTIILPVGLI